MTATDELRRLLDERGVRHIDGFPYTTWLSSKGLCTAYENVVDDTLMLTPFTPEQAVEATLGSDLEAENERLRELVRDALTIINLCTIDCYPSDNKKRELNERARELGVEV